MKDIILLEDNSLNVELIRIILKDFQVNLTVCMTSNEFDDKFEDIFDLIILDVMVPGGKDGIEICKELREKGIKTPIFIHSAYGEKEIDCEENGADEFIEKPMNFKRFKTLLKKYLYNDNKRNSK